MFTNYYGRRPASLLRIDVDVVEPLARAVIKEIEDHRKACFEKEVQAKLSYTKGFWFWKRTIERSREEAEYLVLHPSDPWDEITAEWRIYAYGDLRRAKDLLAACTLARKQVTSTIWNNEPYILLTAEDAALMQS